MRAHFGLPSVENDELEGKPPITVKFEIPYFTVSGIQVRAGVEATPMVVLMNVRLMSGWDGSLSRSPGTVHEDYRKKRLSGVAVGAVHHTKWR